MQPHYKELVILRQIPAQDRLQKDHTRVLAFEELKEQILHGKIFQHLFRYSTVRMLCPQIGAIHKPLKTIIILKCLSRGECLFEQEDGAIQKINWPFFLKRLKIFIRDWLRKPALLKKTDAEIAVLESQSTLPRTNRAILDDQKVVVYFRTDPIYGLKSGGSVAHISGVLNQLPSQFPHVCFLTTDRIPLVNREIETHVLPAGRAFDDFSELLMLFLNSEFSELAARVTAQKNIAFVYQRYALNSYSGVALALQHQVPFVLEYNGSEIWVRRNWGGKSLQYEDLTLRIENLNFAAADLIVVVSEVLKDQLIARGVNANKILVNPNGVDPERYSPAINGAEIRRKFHLTDKTVIGFIGTFGRWHGAEVLAQAFAKLLQENSEYQNELRLLLVGNGDTIGEVKSIIQRHHLENSCILTGTVTQEEGPLYLAACDILVAPHIPNADGSKFFGSPTKLFEYMSMGKGIVASNLDQIGEILTHQKTAWMVQPGDAADLARGIEALVKDKPLRREIGIQARRLVEMEYTWKQHVRRIIQRLEAL